MKNGRITVMFPVNHLGVGGAEQQLLELVRGIDKERFAPVVVTLYPGGPLETEMKAVTGAELVCLERKGKYDFSVLLDISRLLRKKHVQVIQPFLTPASFFGLVPALVDRRLVKVVTERCGVRVNPRLGSAMYRKAEDFLTRFADWIIPNSKAGEDYVIARGIGRDRLKVIYNGINLERLEPDPDTVARIRRDMKIPPGGKVVGITASLTPAKDHATFLEAAKLVLETVPETRFAVLGQGPLKEELEALAERLGIGEAVTFFGAQRDIGSHISVYDIACLSSFDHEGCSNATLEAMAIGKPVVVTDVGGNRETVEDGVTGTIVPPKDPVAFAGAIIDYLRNPDRASRTGEQARQKVRERFSVERMVKDYEVLYETAVEVKARRRNGNGTGAA